MLWFINKTDSALETHGDFPSLIGLLIPMDDRCSDIFLFVVYYYVTTWRSAKCFNHVQQTPRFFPRFLKSKKSILIYLNINILKFRVCLGVNLSYIIFSSNLNSLRIVFFRCGSRIWSRGGAPGAEAESCRRSEAESRERSEQFAAGVQEAFGSFWVFNAQICIFPHSRDSFSLIFDIYFNTKSW